MNVRECRQCHRMVDFDEPWCDHETMEESAWLDIRARQNQDAVTKTIDHSLREAAKELGFVLDEEPEKKIED